MSDDRYQFTAKISTRDFGRMAYTVVFAPKRTERELDLSSNPRLRIMGAVDGIPFSGAFQPNGGEWYLILSKKFLKEAGVGLGDRVVVEFEIADQNAVEVPEDLMALARRYRWRSEQSFSMGRQYYANISRLCYLFDDFNDRRRHATQAEQMANADMLALYRYVLDMRRAP